MKNFTLKSMTGFASTTCTYVSGVFDIEIQSVNRRYLEMNISLPRPFLKFENDIRKWIAKKITRGQVTLMVNWKSSAPMRVLPNIAYAKSLKEAWEALAKEIGVPSDLSLSLFAKEERVFLFEEKISDEESAFTALSEAIAEAVHKLDEVRVLEGSTLAEDFKKRIALLEELIEKIALNTASAPSRFQQKLQQRMQDLISGKEEWKERVLQEVLIFAEKIDVTEEIVRFKSHLEQFRKVLITPLKDEAETKGKRLDFLLQELHREVNTIGAKSSDAAVSGWVIDAKCELEKIREQVQNIE